MTMIIRFLGIWLVFLAIVNLMNLFIVDPDTIANPIIITVRYALLFVAGFGFVFAQKWGFVVFVISEAIHWGAFFLGYSGAEALFPFWMEVANPAVIGLLSLICWKQLKPTAKQPQSQNQ